MESGNSFCAALQPRWFLWCLFWAYGMFTEWDTSDKHHSPSNIHLVYITLPSALQGRWYQSHFMVKNLLEQWGNNLPRAARFGCWLCVIPTPDVFPVHHTNKQNEDPTPEKAKTWKSKGATEKSWSPRSSRHRALVETGQLPAFDTNNIELIWAGLWVGRKADAGRKEIPEAFLEKKMGKEKAGGVVLTLTDPEEDSRNWEPRESPGNDSQLCRALLRKWLPLGATN